MKEKIWPLVAVILGTFLVITLFALWQGQGDKTGGQVSSNPTQPQKKPVVLSSLKVSPEPFDWGNIKINGGIVQTQFTLKNEADKAVSIARIETSCMCTEASLKVGEKKSPFFGMPGHAGNPGWQAEITPGEEVTLTVKFDPAAHGPEGLGKVDRVTRIWFSQPENSYRDIAFAATVVK